MDRHDYHRDYYVAHVKHIEKNDRFHRVRVARIMGLLKARPEERILDLGCGAGTLFLALLNRGCRPLGMDFSFDALCVCRGVLLRFGKGYGGGLLNGDAKCLPIKEACLDGIVAGDLTEHLNTDDLIRLCRECIRVLKPAGRMVIYTPNPQHLFELLKKKNILFKKDPSHIGLRTMEAYIHILDNAGFEIEAARFEPTHIPGYAQLERWIIKWPLVGKLARRRICLRVRKRSVQRKFQS